MKIPKMTSKLDIVDHIGSKNQKNKEKQPQMAFLRLFLLSKTKNEATKKATAMFFDLELSVDPKNGIIVRDFDEFGSNLWKNKQKQTQIA